MRVRRLSITHYDCLRCAASSASATCVRLPSALGHPFRICLTALSPRRRITAFRSTTATATGRRTVGGVVTCNATSTTVSISFNRPCDHPFSDLSQALFRLALVCSEVLHRMGDHVVPLYDLENGCPFRLKVPLRSADEYVKSLTQALPPAALLQAEREGTLRDRT